MMKASLILNIIVLVPICTALMTGAVWVEAGYGEATPARGILLSIYLAILGASAVLLVIADPRMVATLLAVQILYKLTTPLTVGTMANPVVISNLLIAAFHLVSIWTIRTELRR
jgi:hypothetical protein